MKRGHVGAFRGGRSIKRSAPGSVVVVGGSAPTVTAIVPTEGIDGGGTFVTITGTNFVESGLVVTIGGEAVTGLSVVNTTTITGLTGAKAAGAAQDVYAETENGNDTLEAAYTYVATNEPAGMTVYSDRGFDDTVADGNGRLDSSEVYNSAVGWYQGNLIINNGHWGIVSDATGAHSAPNVGRITYYDGLAGGSSAIGSIHGLTLPGSSNHTIYVRMWYKPSSGFVGHSSGVNKTIFIKRYNDQAVVTFSFQGSGSNDFQAQMRTQSIPSGELNLGQNAGLGLIGTTEQNTLYRDVWNRIETVVTMNTPGVDDGTVDVWVNGVHTISYSTVQWAATEGVAYWDGVTIEPIWGGSGGTNSAEFYMDIDHLYVSGKA